MAARKEKPMLHTITIQDQYMIGRDGQVIVALIPISGIESGLHSNVDWHNDKLTQLG